ncbi:MAG: low affinity iron permease family protein [Candidatus Pacebacteria bacterium]|nr:low affinity iron permease family protein [Candidatus Paceibacterota bacterium]
MSNIFRIFSAFIAKQSGKPRAFIAALSLIIVWALSGQIFNYSDTWQLVINTTTTVVTFLMVFLIQNTQNRDSKAVHLKLDELVRANRMARNMLLDIEAQTDEELDKLIEEFRIMNVKYQKACDRREAKKRKENGNGHSNGHNK